LPKYWRVESCMHLTTPEPEFKCISITWYTWYQYRYWPNTHIPVSESGVSVKVGISGTLNVFVIRSYGYSQTVLHCLHIHKNFISTK